MPGHTGPVRVPIRTVTVLAGLILMACASVRPRELGQNPQVGRVITQEQIRGSGASNAWEAMKFTVRSHYFGDYKGLPVRITSDRGVGSFLLREEPLIFLDGTRLADIYELTSIPVQDLLEIRVLSGNDGTTYYGTSAVAGVILIKTVLGDVEPDGEEDESTDPRLLLAFSTL